MAALPAMSIDIYLPAMPRITEYFHTLYAHTQLTISLFLLAYGLFQLVWGPLSDRFGRKPILIAGLTLYILAALVCVFAPTLSILILARFCQGIGASAISISSFAIVRDIFEGKQAVKVMSYLTTAMGCSPILAPIIGAYLQHELGWRSNFTFLVIVSVVLLLAIVFKFAETSQTHQTLAKSTASVLQTYFAILSNRLYKKYAVCSILAFVILIAFATNAPYYMMTLGKVSAQYFAVLFAINALGLVLGSLITSRLIIHFKSENIILFGASLILLGGIFMTGVIALFSVSAVLFIIAMLFCTFGIALIFPPAMAGALAPFREKAGSASALTGCLRFVISGIAAAVIGYLQIVHVLSLPLLILLCGILIVLMAINLKYRELS